MTFDENSIFYLNEFCVDATKRTLSTDTRTTQLEPKVMQLLLFFCCHQGEVVSRQQILDEIWPSVIITDNTLSQFITKLRKHLHDDAKTPVYIQTIPKKGYLFKATVIIKPLRQNNSENIKSNRKRRQLGYALLLLLFIAAIYIFRDLPIAEDFTQEHVISTMAGVESAPVFSQDGLHVLFTYLPPKAINKQLWIKENAGKFDLTAQKSAFAVIDEPGLNISFPQWSSTGKFIGYVERVSAAQCFFIIRAVQSASPFKIGDIHAKWPCRFHDKFSKVVFSNDDNQVFFNRSDVNTGKYQIWRYHVQTEDEQLLSRPKTPGRGDISFLYLTEADELLAIRDIQWSHIYLVGLDLPDGYQQDSGYEITGGFANGEPNNITVADTDAHFYIVADRNETLKASFSTGIYYSVYEKSGLEQIDFDRNFHQLVGVKSSSSKELHFYRNPHSQLMYGSLRHVNETVNAHNPTLLRDNRLIYASERSGVNQLWLQTPENNEYQITDFEEETTFGVLNWSYALNKAVMFTEHSGATLFHFEGTEFIDTPVFEDFSPLHPVWHPDGRQLIFTSYKSGTWQLWLGDIAKGSAKPLTSKGGFYAKTNKNSILFTRFGKNGLWKIESQQVSKVNTINYFANMQLQAGTWVAGDEGIYYLNHHSDTGLNTGIVYVDFSEQSAELVVPLPLTGNEKLAISDDQATFIITVRRTNENDLILLKK